MRLAIIGSRNFAKTWKIKQYVSNLPREGLSIISGGAEGADTVAVQQARLLGIPCRTIDIERVEGFPERFWPLTRNLKIAQGCDEMVAFWDGKSKGTLDAITKAVQLGKMVTINP